MIEYKVNVTDIAERRNEINGKASASADRRPFYKLRNRVEQLPVIQISLRLPVYRLENYRTQTRQLSKIRSESLPKDFFKQEDVEAQQAQHEILYDFAQQGMGDTVMAITTALAQDKQQTDPLIITREGVVVNGNRRLAAMRELFATEQDRYEKFATLDVMVLPPDVTQKELKEVEFRLQMGRQTLLPYEWQDRALAIRDLRNSGVSAKEIQVLMRLEKESEVTALLDQLAEAEVYMEEYLGTPGEYDRVADQDQLFGDLQAALAKKVGPEKEVARRIGHVMAKNSKKFGTRVYDYKQAFGTKCTKVVARLAERRGIDVEEPTETEEDIFGGDGSSDPFAAVKELLKKPEESETLAVDIREVFDEIREEEKENEVGRKPLKSVQRAGTLLNDVVLDQADSSTIEPIRVELIGIRDTADKLLAAIEKRQKKTKAK